MLKKTQLIILSIIITTLSLQAIASKTDYKSKSTHYQTREILQGYPEISANLNLPPRPGKFASPSQGLRMAKVSYDKLTNKQAERIAQKAAKSGFTQILSEHNRYLFYRPDEPLPLPNRSYPETLKQMIENGRKLSDACHRHGIQFIVHLTCTMVTKDYLDRHPSYASIDLKTGKRTSYARRSLTSICNKDFMNDYLKRLKKYLKGTNADGAMVDEVAFWGSTTDGCKACRKEFFKATGEHLPTPKNYRAFFNRNNPAYREWRRWRTEKVKQVNQEITDVVHQCGGLRYDYRANPMPTRYPYLRSGYFLSDFINSTDVIGYESEPHGYRNVGYLYYWPLIIANLKNVYAMSLHTKGAPWVLFYPKSISYYTWTWLEARSQGVRLWWQYRDKKARSPLMNWERNYEKILENSKPYANIGILLSKNSAFHYPRMAWLKSYISTINALTDSHSPYQIVLDRDISIKRLQKMGINTLFVMNSASMSNKQVKVIKDFVKNGNTIISSADASLYTSEGLRRKDFALANVFGVSYKGKVNSKNNKIILSNSINLHSSKNNIHTKQEFNNITVNSGLLAGIIIDKKDKKYPYLVINNYGKGMSLYFSGHPALNYIRAGKSFNNIIAGKKWQDHRIDYFRKLLAKTATYSKKPQSYIANNFPRGVTVTALYQHNDGIKGVKVLLTNFLGGKLKSGIVPSIADVSFPDVAKHRPDTSKPMTVSVRMAAPPKDVYVISPDFKKIVSLPFKSLKNGMYQIRIPNVYRFEIIYFVQKGSNKILTLNNKKVTDQWPDVRPLNYKTVKPLVGEYDPKAHVVFAYSNNFTGGVKNIRINRAARIVYGGGTKESSMKATIHLSSNPHQNISLVVGAKDARLRKNNKTIKVPIKITVNNKVVFEGTSFSDSKKWGVYTFKLPKELLHKGKNYIKISNTYSVHAGHYAPTLAINFVKIAPK